MFSLSKSFQRFRSQPQLTLIFKSGYVDVKMKWKKDPFYDSIEAINKNQLLRSLISLKNMIAASPDSCIPVSVVSKLKYRVETPTKVSNFLRQYPSVFEEFRGPHHDLPWFRLTPEAFRLDLEEQAVYRDCREDIILRLRKLLLMSRGKSLPLEIIRGMQWYLGLPEDFLNNPEADIGGSIEFCDLGDGGRGLKAIADPRVETQEVSYLQKRYTIEGPIEFPLFPSKGLRLKRKIEDWLQEFQKLEYISPYIDFSNLSHQRRDSDEWEKRVVGVLHELLCLFVDHSAERRKLRCLRRYLGLPEKFGEAFVRHPHIFYLCLKGKTCTVILKEAYANGSPGIEEHPVRKVRYKYLELMNRSRRILRDRREGKVGSDENLGLSKDGWICESADSPVSEL